MTSTIQYFSGINPQVQRILTFSGGPSRHVLCRKGEDVDRRTATKGVRHDHDGHQRMFPAGTWHAHLRRQFQDNGSPLTSARLLIIEERDTQVYKYGSTSKRTAGVRSAWATLHGAMPSCCGGN